MTQDSSSGSITHWISELKNGESSRAQCELWNRYFQRLIALAGSRLPANARQASDDEDAVSSAINSFFRRADLGEFPGLNDRMALWPLLAQITLFKAMRNVRHKRAEKRGGGKVMRESELATLANNANFSLPTFEELISNEPTADLAMQMNEEATLLMGELPDEQLRQIAQLKLEGYRNNEIGDELGLGLRTVERKLAIIRSYWTDRSNDEV